MSALPLPQAGPWSHISRATQSWMVLHIIAVITLGLWLDITHGWTGQHIATVWAMGVWAWLYYLGRRDERRILVVATLLSGLGECFLSLIWGLYDYQFLNVPLFVPPGHALLMTLGLLAARHVKSGLVLTISIGAAAWGIYMWVFDIDRFGVMLFGLYAVCMLFGRARALYATMFVLALAMELYGTALGNWFWHSPAPWVHLSAANPPYSAGAFYCVLDLLVLAILRAQLPGVVVEKQP